MRPTEEQCRALIDRTAKRIFTKDSILPYLDFMNVIYTFDAQNQLLIYGQKPDAKILAGKMAWEHLDRKVTDLKHPIFLLMPLSYRDGDGHMAIKRQVCQLYDVSATVSDDGKMPETANHEMNIVGLFRDREQYQFEHVSDGQLEEMISPARATDEPVYIDDNDVIYYSDRIDTSSPDFAEKLINAWIDRHISEMDILDLPEDNDRYSMIIKLCVRYLLHKRYLSMSSLTAQKFAMVSSNIPVEDIKMILQQINSIMRSMIWRVEGIDLCFDEVAYVAYPCILSEYTVRGHAIYRILADIYADTTTDDNPTPEIDKRDYALANYTIQDKIAWLCEEEQEIIFNSIRQKELFTYPPYHKSVEADNEHFKLIDF